jgi:hypothetical protein
LTRAAHGSNVEFAAVPRITRRGRREDAGRWSLSARRPGERVGGPRRVARQLGHVLEPAVRAEQAVMLYAPELKS